MAKRLDIAADASKAMDAMTIQDSDVATTGEYTSLVLQAGGALAFYLSDASSISMAD